MLAAIKKVLDAPKSKRHGMPISYITDAAGERHVLSRYGDERIDLSPYLKNPASDARFIELDRFPERWRDSILDLLLAYWHFGRPGHAAPKASTVLNKATLLVGFIRWLDRRKIARFADVRPVHVSSFAQELSEDDGTGSSKRKPGGLAATLSAAALAWELRGHLVDAMPVPPFGKRGRIGQLAKMGRRGSKQLTTQDLPEKDAAVLFAACEAALEGIDDVLADYEEIEAYKVANPVGKNSKYRDRDIYHTMPHLYGRWRETETRINDARAACFVELGLLVGTRISETLLLESGCYFEREMTDGRVGWVRGRTLKMRPDGNEWTEWVAPERVGELIRILDRIAGPYRVRLRLEMERMEKELDSQSLKPQRKLYLLERLNHGRESINRLFLTDVKNKPKQLGGYIRSIGRGATEWIKRMLKRAGLQVHVHPHMLRRTYAVMVVLQCAGDLRFLRKQFQHWSIETTQLYATHAAREQELVDEIAEEMLKQKVDIVTHWLMPNTLLAGKGGLHIAEQRAAPEFRGLMEKDLRVVATHLSDGLVVRSTGHTWCISTPTPSCGGQGLYDATHCADCDSSVVTEEKRTIWELLAWQMLEVKALNDTGPVGQQLAERSLAAFDDILRPLGSSVEHVEQSMRALP